VNRRLSWAPDARTDLAALGKGDPQTERRIRSAMRRFASDNVGDVKKLAGYADTYRLRVGDWRVLFSFRDGGLVVLALRVLNRRDAYR